MQKAADKFVGKWKLIPELCQYEDCQFQQRGAYEISLNGKSANFSIDWTDAKGEAHKMSYGGPVDGTVSPLNGGKIEVSFTRVDKFRLDSSTYLDGAETSYAHRKASDDGNLMVVLTVQHHRDEVSTRNFQVYRRA